MRKDNNQNRKYNVFYYFYSNKALAADQLEILTILKQAAHSLEDKYKVLEARDKLIRLRTKKYIDLTRGHTVGTCPDMCPERERLMREIQHQVNFVCKYTSGSYIRFCRHIFTNKKRMVVG